MKERIWNILAIVLILGLAVAACRPAATPAPTKVPATKAPEPTKPPAVKYEDEWGVVTVEKGDTVKVGIAFGLSGVGTDVLGIDELRGAELALKDKPEIMGFEVGLVVEDESCSAEGGQTVANKMVANPQIVAVAGHMCSSSCLPASKTYEQHHYTMVSPSCTAPGLTMPALDASEIFNRVCWSDMVQGPAAGSFVKDVLGVDKIATIHDGSPYAEQLADVFAEAFEGMGGQVVAREAVNVGDTDMRPVLTRIKAGDPELIYAPIFPAEAGYLAAQRPDVGMEDVIFMGADGILADVFIEAAGNMAEGVYASAADFAEAGPALPRFLEAYKATYGEDPIAPFHAHAYDAYMVIANAIEKVAEVDAEGNLLIGRKKLRDAIRATKDYQGLTGKITCDENGDCGTGTVAFSVVKGGAWVAAAAPAPAEVGKVIVGTNAEYPPFEMVDEAGNIVGFDPDLMVAIAEAAGFEFEWVNTKWDGIFVALASGEFDAVISAATITAERAQTVDFSDPYFEAGQAIIVRAAETEIKTADDLAGKKVGVQLGTTGDIWLTDETAAEVLRYEENTLAVQALAAGDVDAAVMDNPTAAEIVKANPELNLKLLPGVYTEENYGIAVSKDRPEVLAAINEGLAAVKASGEYDEIWDKWFGVEEVVAPGKTFIFGRGGDSVQLDPAVVTDGESFRVTGQVLEPLFQYEDGGTTPIPALATGFEATPDSKEWTISLREGVKFHDGTPFNADAVVLNYERQWKTDHPLHFESQVFEYWEYMFNGFDEDCLITKVEAVDDLTVKITLKEPLAPLLANLAMDIFAISSPAALEEYGADYGMPTVGCVGTGPFKFVEWLEDDHITVDANMDYWGGAPTIGRIIWRVIPDDSARYLALKAGEIHALEQANVEDLKDAAADPNLYVNAIGLNTGYLAFNYHIKELQDPKVREAVFHAIDREALKDAFYGDYGQVASTFLHPKLWGRPDIEDWTYDPDLSRQLLAEAGFPDGLKEVTNEDTGEVGPLKFYYMPVTRFYYPSPKEIGEAMAADLAKVGIETELYLEGDWATFLGSRREGRLYGLYQLGWGGDNGDPDNFLNYFFGGLSAPGQVKEPDPREGYYANQEVADLLYQAATEPDQAKRAPFYEEVERLLHEDRARLWVIHNDTPRVLSAKVSGFVVQPVGADKYERVVIAD